MDGGPRTMCYSKEWWFAPCLLHTDYIQACVAWDEPVMQEKLFFIIWLYPNECNSVFSNWRQQNIVVFPAVVGDLTCSTGQMSTPGPSVCSAGVNSVPSWVTYNQAIYPARRLNDNMHVHTLKHKCTELQQQTCTQWKCFLKESRGNSIVRTEVYSPLSSTCLLCFYVYLRFPLICCFK